MAFSLVTAGVAQGGAQGSAEEWAVRLDLRIGAVDGPQALSLVGGLEVDAQGRLYVLQPMDAMIRVFDAEGRALESIGGRGGGPEEFRAPIRMGWRGDTLWVLDSSSQRLSFWRDGTLARTLRIESIGFGDSFAPGFPIAVLEDGAFLVAAVPRTDPKGKRLARDAPILRARLDGTGMVRLAVLRATDRPVLTTPSGSQIRFSYQPFDDGTLLRVSPHGDRMVLVERKAPSSGDPASFTVLALTAGGDTLFRLAVPYRPQRLTRDVVDAVVQVPDPRLLSRYPSPAAARDAIREALFIPAWQPPVSDLVVGRDHTVWLRGCGVGTGWVEWLVLDERGGYLGRLAMPDRLQVLQAQRDQVWGVLPDDLDVPFVVRYRVEKRTPAAPASPR